MSDPLPSYEHPVCGGIIRIYGHPIDSAAAGNGYFRPGLYGAYLMNRGRTGYFAMPRNPNHAKRIARNLRRRIRELVNTIQDLQR